MRLVVEPAHPRLPVAGAPVAGRVETQVDPDESTRALGAEEGPLDGAQAGPLRGAWVTEAEGVTGFVSLDREQNLPCRDRCRGLPGARTGLPDRHHHLRSSVAVHGEG